MLQRCDRHRRPVEAVPAAICQGLAALLVGLDAEPVDAAAAVSYLDRLRTRREWLRCECRPAGQPQPTLFPCRRSDSGTLFLRREVGVEHASGCLWHRLIRNVQDEAAGDGQIGPLVAYVGSPFLLRKPARSGRALLSTAQSSASASSRVPALARVLFGLVLQARLDRVAGDEVRPRSGGPGAVDPKAQYDRLRTFDECPVGGELYYRQLLCTWLPGLPKHLDRLRRLRPSFPASMRPQGLFWGVVDEIDVDGASTQVRASYGPAVARRHMALRLPVAVTVPGRCRRGPFWVIAALGAPGDDARTPFEVVDAYAHPAYSRSLLLPVDSDAERSTARVLLELLCFRDRHHGIRLLLRKPLETFRLDDGAIVPPPDFLVELPGGESVAVETMGALDDPAYVARKRQTHDMMRRIPGVAELIEHDPKATDRFRCQLFRACAGPR